MGARAIILAGGYGKRWKLSVPKPLYEINGKPVIRHLIDSLRPYVSAFSILTNRAHAPSYAGLLFPIYGSKINVIPEPHDQEAFKWGAYFGTVSHLNYLQMFAPEDSYVIVPGDSYYNEPAPWELLIKATELKGSPAVIFVARISETLIPQLGNVKLSVFSDTVVQFVEKPAQPISPWVWTGAIALNADIVPKLPKLHAHHPDRDKWGYIITALLENNIKVRAIKVRGWEDIGLTRGTQGAVSQQTLQTQTTETAT